MLAPIVLFVYNRLWHTKQTVDSLRVNELANKSELIVVSDGAKNKNEEINVEAVRNYIKSISGFKSVQIIKRIKNYGLAQNIITGVTEVVDEYGKVIVLEDDLVTSRYFLSYMNDALNVYEKSEGVISIHGYMYPVKKRLTETFFIKGADCWGWATWKRGWDLFNRDGTALLNQIKVQKKESVFDFEKSYPYMKMLQDQTEGKNNSWAVRWYASAFLSDKLTLYPRQTLVKNIGFDGSGTHCGCSESMNDSLIETNVKVEKITIRENIECRKIIAAYFRSLKRPLGKRVLNKVNKSIKRIVNRLKKGLK